MYEIDVKVLWKEGIYDFKLNQNSQFQNKVVKYPFQYSCYMYKVQILYLRLCLSTLAFKCIRTLVIRRKTHRESTDKVESS